MRIDVADFRARPLRVHKFLHDVPLEDAWAIELKGGGNGRSIEDLQNAFTAGRSDTPAFVKGLFALRGALGIFFGWDKRSPEWKEESYISRLTASDRALTSVVPGSDDGRFQFIYRFENEQLSEVRNGTVHAFLSLSIQPSPTGYVAYLGVYVKPTGWFTRVYMSAIAPFRHLAVYPAMVRNTQRVWDNCWRS